MRLLKFTLFGLLGLIVVGLAAIKLLYGGGTPYPSVATQPLRTDAERAIELPFPPGMVAVGPTGRVFFTYHPFHAPEAHTDALLFEWQGGEALPIGADLGEKLHGIFGITVDRRGWVWGVRPGALAGRATEVIAIDPDAGALMFEFEFPDGMGGFAQDLRVSDDLTHVYFADTGLLRFTPAALLVLNTETRVMHEVLKGHPSTQPQNWVMRKTDGSPYKLGYGLVTFQVGVDGLEISADGDWLIYATMTHDAVFRAPIALLNDPGAPQTAIEASVERLGPGPMSDGIAVDAEGAVILTDVENGGLMRLDGSELTTLVTLPEVDWADSVSIAPNGDIWFTDSALTALLDPFGNPPSRAEIDALAPYAVYRIPGK